MAPTARPRVAVWMHYDKKDNSRAECRHCKQNLSYKTTTENLTSHLKKVHASIYLAQYDNFGTLPAQQSSDNTITDTNPPVPQASSSSASGSEPSCSSLRRDVHFPKRQRTINSYMPKKITQADIDKINRDLLELFITDYQPFRIVEDKGFKKFAKHIPGYSLPSRKTISSSMIPALYQKTLDEVKETVTREANSVCITTDCWTSSQTESYIGVTAHFIDENFEPRQFLLECRGFSESHTSANLAEELKRVTNEWGLLSKVNFAISDNAKNIVKAIETDLGWKHYGCYAHSLNLIVQNALKTVESTLDNIKKIVAHFKRSTSATDMLLSYQIKNMKENGEAKRLVQAVPTRWNSSLFMLQRFVNLKEAVRHCMALIDKDWPIISVEEWEVCSQLCTVLQPFEEVTSSISGENYMTGRMVIVMTNILSEICDDFLQKEEYTLFFHRIVKDVVIALKDGLKLRFTGIEHSKTFGLCTLLDPRFKLYCFKNEYAVSEIKKHAHHLIIGIINKEVTSQEKNNDIEQQTNVTATVSAWDRCEKMLKKSRPEGNAQARAIRELQMYCEDEMLPRMDAAGNWSNPSQWWREHRIIYPHLAEIYRNKCNIVATSVPCERLFSKTGLIINEKRCRLKSTEVEQLAFLNANLSPKRFMQ